MLLKSFEVKQEWVDYNSHMNMAYYVLVFDQALEVALEKFNMGESAAKNLNRTTMVVETNTKYLNEVRLGEEVDIQMTYFDHDTKRLHVKMEMIKKGKKEIFMKTVLNDEEGISKISTCKWKVRGKS